MRLRYGVALALGALLAGGVAARPQAQTRPAGQGAVAAVANARGWDYGVLFQGGKGFTEDRDDFTFFLAGGHVGKVLTPEMGKGLLQGNFEYAAELFPYWQSNTPTFQRRQCTATTDPTVIACSAPYTVGGTFHGVSATPIILRWSFTRGHRLMPWAQAAGGVLWTNHKYPAYGQGPLNIVNDGPGSDASVWNFTPQGGVGVHYFVRPGRSVDLSANGIHISSASLGDRNPGVNATVQFSIGYSWWKGQGR